MKKQLWMMVAALVLACGMLCLAGCFPEYPGASSEQPADDVVTSVAPDDPYGSGKHTATVTVKGYEPFTVELDADAAPVTVSNFCHLALDGFYDGKTFYRFSDGYCMQGGSTGNSAAVVDDGLPHIVGEFSANGIDNALADDFHRGVVAMTRSRSMNSATSAFFITLDKNDTIERNWNGQYAAFGTVDEAGMKVVDQIVADYLPKVTDSRTESIGPEDEQAQIVSITID